MWNFVEIMHDYTRSHDSNELYWIIGSISQNVNAFLEKGYSWQIEYWL
jgi:hypothetical protein